MLSVEATLTHDSSPQEVRDARLASVPLSIRNRSSLALLIFMALLFRTRPPWPRQPRACVNGARYDIISLLGRSVTLVTFHSVDASEIDCCVPRGHGSVCGRCCCKIRKSNDAKKSRESRFLDVCISTTCHGADTRVPGRLCVKRCGPSRRRLRNASAVLKTFVPRSKKTFSTLSARSSHSGSG